MDQKLTKLPVHLKVLFELLPILGLFFGTCYLIWNNIFPCLPKPTAWRWFPLLIHFIEGVAHHTNSSLRPAEHKVIGSSMGLHLMKECLAVKKVKQRDHGQKVHEIAIGSDADKVDHCEGRVLGLGPEPLSWHYENADEGMQQFHRGQKNCPKHDETIPSRQLPFLSQQIRHLRIIDEDNAQVKHV